ncbi:ring-cleaving dioxygenase [Halorubellus sp. JP-L1]|uniref:VOC family protein n=1 Tax=Halorubellus sp. JP-L1 TaxID=2715753 RepID=UPI00140DB663|nr:VOC family protein [Halorubellus sp. JP-L1]NHN41539.1 ring-cleaving dioxygenase [Halorubellus sp. JP-L1]
MLPDTPGIHHVTSMVGDPQANVDFYADVLGLRLVKRTVNHEDVLRYHLYYGNDRGDLGTVYTCFPYPNEPPGRVGPPQIAAASFAVPPASLPYWRDRLEASGVDVERRERFDETVLQFVDPAGTRLELVGAHAPVDPYAAGPIPAEHGIRGVHGVTALPVDPFQTASVLETLGLDAVGQDGDRVRYRADGPHATVVDVLDRGAASASDDDAAENDDDAPADAGRVGGVAFGREGVGTIHHVAVRVPDEDALFAYHDLFRERDVQVSRVRDRHYYRSVYVREPGGILIELATEDPGLAVDEPIEALGSSLVLPPWAAEDREMIESQLPAVDFPDQPGGGE